MDEFWDQWNKFPLAGKFLLVILIWGALGVGYYFTFYEEQNSKYKSLANRFRKTRNTRIKHQTIANNLPRWEAEVARLRGELAKAQTLLPTSKEIPNLLRKIDDLSKKSGLSVVRFSPKNEKKKNFYNEVPMEMEVNGTFYEIMFFFDSISKLDRIVNVQRIRLESPKLKNQKLRLVARFRLLTYRFTIGAKKRKKKR